MSDLAFSDRDNFVRNMVTVRSGPFVGSELAARRLETVGPMPLTVDDMAEDLRVDEPDDERTTLERMMMGAARFIERRTAYVIVPTRYEVALSSFGLIPHWFSVHRGPFRELESVEYLTAKDTWATVAALNYWTQQRDRDLVVNLISTFDPPDIWEEAREGGIRVRFTAGFDDDSGDLPIDEGVVSLWVMVTGHFYKNRELPLDKVEAGATTLLGSYRTFW